MSPKGKLITWLIIIIILGAGGYWYISNYIFSNNPANETTTVATTTDPSAFPIISLPTGINDTSDSALDIDISMVEAEIIGLNSDLENVDKALNDKPIEQ